MSFVHVSFFDRYPEFNHNPRASIRDEFNRLAKSQNWTKKETAKKRMECYNDEFEGYFANLELDSGLERLQYLCVELDITPKDTVTHVHVNIVHLMDARRTNTKVKKFSSNASLVRYIRKTKEFFPLEEAKGDVIKVLLRQIFYK
ncbi:unnamed protein product [Aureobasidium mustum]|uniref:Uncharacterized protein n=1 Tax=Aureobasidium mustum TaxID=2773714 RepID=A0A9N8K1F7_9PEZI|nr:unnamed protein product [Aureobasidium mustum]